MILSINRQNSFIIQSMETAGQKITQEYADDYQVHLKIGDGGQANVYLASKNNQLYALKVYLPGASKQAAYQVETDFLHQLKHPHLINMVSHNPKANFKLENSPQERRAIIALQLAQGGEIFQYISKQGRFTPQVCRYYAKQLISTLKYLVERDVTHRDIKPENILLDSHFNIKISDFGLSRNAKGDQGDYKLRSRVGTEGYRPPEMEEGKYTGIQADMFAAGVVLFVMYNGSPPFFSTRSHDRVYKHIRERNFTKFWSLHEKGKPQGFYSSSFKKIINSFLSADPDRRPTFDSLEDDEWWNGHDITQQELEEYMKPKAELLFQNSKINQIKKNLFKDKIEEEQNNLSSSETRSCPEDDIDNYSKQDKFVMTYNALSIIKEDLPQYTNKRVVYFKEEPAFVVAWIKDMLADLFEAKQIFLEDYVGEIVPQNFYLQYKGNNFQIQVVLQFLVDNEEEVELQLVGQLHRSQNGEVGVLWHRKRGNFYWLAAIESRLKKLN